MLGQFGVSSSRGCEGASFWQIPLLENPPLAWWPETGWEMACLAQVWYYRLRLDPLWAGFIWPSTFAVTVGGLSESQVAAFAWMAWPVSCLRGGLFPTGNRSAGGPASLTPVLRELQKKYVLKKRARRLPAGMAVTARKGWGLVFLSAGGGNFYGLHQFCRFH